MALTPITLNKAQSLNLSALSASGVIQESSGAKLRRMRTRLFNGNRLNADPYFLEADWAASTVYSRGEIVKNGGQLYIALGSATVASTVSGTSAASGGPTGTGPGLIVDGTVGWNWYGVPTTTANDPLAPVITFVNSAPNSNGTVTALTAITYLNPSSAVLKYQSNFPGAAGYAAPTGGTNKTYPSVSSYKYADGRVDGPGAKVIVGSQAAKIAFTVGANVTGFFSFRVAVDQHDGKGYRYLRRSAYVFTLAADPGAAIVIDWTGVGGSKPRTYVIEMTRTCGLNNVRVSPLDTIWAPTTSELSTIYYISDSHGEGTPGNYLGSSNNLPLSQIPYQTCLNLGAEYVINDSVGGTGYVNDNTSNRNYLQRLTLSLPVLDAAAFQVDAFIFDEALINDSGIATGAQIRDAMLNCIALIRSYARYAATPIIVLGGGETSNSTATNFTAIEALMTAGIAALNDPYTFGVISKSTDPAGAWITGTGKTSAPAGNGSADLYVDVSGSHWVEIGLNYIGRRNALAIAANVLAFIP